MALLRCLYLCPQQLKDKVPRVFAASMGLVRLVPPIFGDETAVISVIFYSAWAAHALEALGALWLLHRADLLRLSNVSSSMGWFGSTFLFGYPSLRVLRGRLKARAQR